jgi:hypothetical protein
MVLGTWIVVLLAVATWLVVVPVVDGMRAALAAGRRRSHGSSGPPGGSRKPVGRVVSLRMHAAAAIHRSL